MADSRHVDQLVQVYIRVSMLKRGSKKDKADGKNPDMLQAQHQLHQISSHLIIRIQSIHIPGITKDSEHIDNQVNACVWKVEVILHSDEAIAKHKMCLHSPRLLTTVLHTLFWLSQNSFVTLGPQINQLIFATNNIPTPEIVFYNLSLLYDPHLLWDTTCCLDGSPDPTSNLSSSIMESDNRCLKYKLPASPNRDNFSIPILLQGKNITAFQKPNWYSEYIETLLRKHQNNGLPTFLAKTPKMHQENGLPNFLQNVLANLKAKQTEIMDSGWSHLLFTNFDGMKLTHFDNSLWDQRNKKLKFLNNLLEKTVKDFLNTVIGHLGAIYSICSDSKTSPYHCLFNACTRNYPISSGSASCKPNVCLVSKAIQESDHRFHGLSDFSWPCNQCKVVPNLM